MTQNFERYGRTSTTPDVEYPYRPTDQVVIAPPIDESAIPPRPDTIPTLQNEVVVMYAGEEVRETRIEDVEAEFESVLEMWRSTDGEQVDDEENKSAINPNIIKASEVRDQRIFKRIVEVNTILGRVSEISQNEYKSDEEKSERTITLTDEEYSEWEAEQIKAAERNIQAIYDQLNRKLSQARALREDTITREEYLKQKSGEHYIRNNAEAIARLDKMKGDLADRLSQHMRRRIQAFDRIEMLNDEFIEKRKALDVAEQDLATYEGKRYDHEQRRIELIDEENELSKKDRKERDKLTDPEIKRFISSYGIDIRTDEDVPETIKAAFAQLRKNVNSDKLSKISSDLADVKEKLNRNKRSIELDKQMIERVGLSITNLKERLAEIPQEIAEQNQILRYEIEIIAPQLDQQSQQVEIVTKQLQDINLGDINAINGQLASELLRNVWNSMGELQQARSRSGQPVEWPEATIEVELLPALHDEPDNEDEEHLAIEASKESLMTSDYVMSREPFENLPVKPSFNFIAAIRRKIGKHGLNVAYVPNNDKDQRAIGMTARQED